MNKIRYIAPVLIAIACLGLQHAKADTVFNLSTPNSGIPGFSGPYVSVDVHLVDPFTASVTFTSLTAAGIFT